MCTYRLTQVRYLVGYDLVQLHAIQLHCQFCLVSTSPSRESADIGSWNNQNSETNQVKTWYFWADLENKPAKLIDKIWHYHSNLSAWKIHSPCASRHNSFLLTEMFCETYEKGDMVVTGWKLQLTRIVHWPCFRFVLICKFHCFVNLVPFREELPLQGLSVRGIQYIGWQSSSNVYQILSWYSTCQAAQSRNIWTKPFPADFDWHRDPVEEFDLSLLKSPSLQI